MLQIAPKYRGELIDLSMILQYLIYYIAGIKICFKQSKPELVPVHCDQHTEHHHFIQ